MLWETAKNKNLIAHNDSLITLISNDSCEKNPTKITNIYWVELFSCTGWKTLKDLNLHPKESGSSNV